VSGGGKALRLKLGTILEQSASRFDPFTPGAHYLGDLDGPQADLNAVAKRKYPFPATADDGALVVPALVSHLLTELLQSIHIIIQTQRRHS
jgi:hypothetical protein